MCGLVQMLQVKVKKQSVETSVEFGLEAPFLVYCCLNHRIIHWSVTKGPLRQRQHQMVRGLCGQYRRNTTRDTSKPPPCCLSKILEKGITIKNEESHFFSEACNVSFKILCYLQCMQKGYKYSMPLSGWY